MKILLIIVGIAVLIGGGVYAQQAKIGPFADNTAAVKLAQVEDPSDYGETDEDREGDINANAGRPAPNLNDPAQAAGKVRNYLGQIDNLIKTLQRQIVQLQLIEKINPTVKAAAVAEMNTFLARVNANRVQMAAAKDAATIAAAFQVYNELRVQKAALTAKMGLVVIYDRSLTAIENASTTASKINTEIAALKASGKNVSKYEPMMVTVATQIAQAKVNTLATIPKVMAINITSAGARGQALALNPRQSKLNAGLTEAVRTMTAINKDLAYIRNGIPLPTPRVKATQ